MLFKNFSPLQLRNAIEIELQKNPDAKLASIIAIKRLKKDPEYYDDILLGMQKARKKMPVGTVSKGYKKVAEGKWVKVGDKKDKQQKKYVSQIDTKEFKNWFGDSKVVDKSGKPLVVYHGTPTGGFENFSEGEKGKRTGHEKKDVGFHFTSDIDYADTYSGSYKHQSYMEFKELFPEEEPKAITLPKNASIYPVYLNIKNPLIIGNEKIDFKKIKYAKDNGHDGIFAGVGSEKTVEYVAFNPNQIKSAIGNKGTFDPESSDMTKAKDTSKLTKKVITNKLGKRQTVYVKIGDDKKEGWINKFSSFFGLKDRRQVIQRIESDYKTNEIDKKFGLTWDGWKNHLSEYFNNKSKWDTFFSGKKEKKESTGKKGDKKEAKKTEKKVKKDGLKLSVMKELHRLYGGKKEPEKVKEPEIKEKPETPKQKTIPAKNGSKIKTNVKPTEAEEKEAVINEETATREGYFNEKPAEILNVGKDVWGAARHNYDTYERFNADIKQMETDGTAQAYVTKKNLIGNYGLANKDERVANGETEYKVLASFVIREYLNKIPDDNNEESRQKYMEFTRAIVRLDDNTKDASTYFLGLAEVFQQLFPQEKDDPTLKRGEVDILDALKPNNGASTIGSVLRVFFNTASGVKSGFYSLDSTGRKQLTNLSKILLSEQGKAALTYDELKTDILGATKASGLKIKKGDNVVFTDDLKDRIYALQTSFGTPENKTAWKLAKDNLTTLWNLRTPERFDRFTDEQKREFGKPIEDYFNTQFNTSKEINMARRKEVERLQKVMHDSMTRNNIYPEKTGQIVKAGKENLHVSFEFPDGKIRTFEVEPSLLKPENIESVKKSKTTKSTNRLNLYVESKVERKGGKNFDSLDWKQSQKILSDKYKFKALQYGNSMPDTEKAYHTKWTLEAFSDLSDVLGIPVEQVTVNGKLGMAFGARGKGAIGGQRGAVAHYEPGTKMINLTRAEGYGSLAHEWSHFMDNILSADMQDFITQNPKRVEKKVTSQADIKHGSIFEIKKTRRGKEVIDRYYFDGNAKRVLYPFVKLAKGESMPGRNPSYTGFYRQNLTVMEPVSVPFMDIASEIGKKSVDSMRKQATEIMDKYDKDDFAYITLKTMVMDDPYLNDHAEGFARAFESYVADKLEDNGRKNTYLASKAKTSMEDGGVIYPQNEFRKEINGMFDKFFEELKKTGDLKKAIEKLSGKDNVFTKRLNPDTQEFEYRRSNK